MTVPRDVAINLVLANLKVVPRPGTNVAEVRYTDRDPARAQVTLDAGDMIPNKDFVLR